MSEILNTMKIIKLQSWEEKFEKLIDSYRENEFTWLAGTQYTKAYGTALYWMCPTIVSSVVFFGCALTGSASLDAATIFTILATLRGMSDPVKMIPETISAMIQVKRSFDRIESFLIADELRIEKLTTVPSRDSNMCIKIQAGKFSWDPESAIPTLRNSDLEVQRGQKIAICGPVGAGKSSVLYAMLGEIPRSSGSVTLFGSIAYVSQASWIQSGTIRDNILYGKPVEETKYKRAVKACALDKDINNFDYGDLTEIGQRGLNMSGGQKQRIQLARAVYSDADIYLLDDPFSAVDAHTAATLFNVRWSNVYIMLRSHTLVLPFQTLDGVTAGLRYGCLTKELKELTIEKVEGEKSFRMEQCKAANLIEEKDTTIKHLEATVAANRLDMETLNSKMEVLHCELRFKEDDLEHFRTSKEMLETEKSDLLTSNKDFASKLDKALQEIRNLEDFANMLAAKLIELDKQSLTFSDKVVQLNSLYDSWFKMVQEEKDLTSQCAKKQYDHLHNVTSHVISEKNELLLLNKELNNNIIEVQKGQEFAMVQHAEECRLAEERIRMLESEAESNLSRKSELELLVSKSEEKLTLYQKVQDYLILKFTALEAESKDSTEILQDEIQKKVEEVNSLQGDIDRHMQHLYALEKQVDKLQTTLEEKEQLVLLSKDREKELEDKKAELQAALVDAESKLSEAKMQYDSMLESKQLELSRHLKELSQRNDQAINDIRRKFEVEMLESVTAEKEKADKVVQEMERKCDQKLAEHKEESHQYLMCLQEEHAALITRIQQEHSMTELNLKSNHSDELKRIQLQTDNELREKTTLLRHEHEVQIRALKCQHEDECRKLQEELDIQKSKEDRQRALLQLQWKVMSDKPPEDQEVNSKKNYSVSSTKVRNSDGGRRSQRAPVPLENEPKDSPYLKATQTPVSTLLKKVEKVNTGSVMSIPKHSRKVTHREYEVETSNGRTIIKRRKTKSTVMFEDPTKRKTRTTPKVNPPRDVHKGMKGGNPHPSNIGDLFSEGSLNPYADDPYAFD